MNKFSSTITFGAIPFHLALVFVFFVLGTSPSWAIVVTNTNNSGSGSLRQAILDARTDPLPNVITFDPALFPATIDVLSLLPVLNGPGDTIDGGGNVTLNAVNLTASTDHGIRIFVSDITIRGLTIQNFGGDGIRVQPNPNAPSGQSGQILTGIVISDNKVTINSVGIRVLGGEDTNQLDVTITDNEISSNFNGGIIVSGSNNTGIGGNSINVTILGNTVRGSSHRDNPLGGDGIGLVGGGGTNTGNNFIQAIITDNTIQSNAGEGLRVVGAGTGSSSSNNDIDTIITDNNIQKNGTGPTGGGNGITITGGPTLGVPATTSGNIITFLVDGNHSNQNRDNGIGVQGSNGSNHVVSGTISNNVFDRNAQFGIRLIVRGSNNTVQDVDILSNSVRANSLGGLSVFGGDSFETVNATVSNLLVDANRFDRNSLGGISTILGTGSGNVISFAGITNNSMSSNGGDGLFIPAGVNGTGTTPITGNRADRNENGGDGIDIRATGYFLSQNSADNNKSGAGISAVGNTNGGGNTAKNNANCNTPGCF